LKSQLEAAKQQALTSQLQDATKSPSATPEGGGGGAGGSGGNKKD
jgi:hypothetical protein